MNLTQAFVIDFQRSLQRRGITLDNLVRPGLPLSTLQALARGERLPSEAEFRLLRQADLLFADHLITMILGLDGPALPRRLSPVVEDVVPVRWPRLPRVLTLTQRRAQRKASAKSYRKHRAKALRRMRRYYLVNRERLLARK